MLFIKHSANRGLTALIVHVDDILITDSAVEEIHLLSMALAQQFEMKALGTLKYFLGIEVAYSNAGILSANTNIFLIFFKRLACWAADLLEPHSMSMLRLARETVVLLWIRLYTRG